MPTEKVEEISTLKLPIAIPLREWFHSLPQDVREKLLCGLEFYKWNGRKSRKCFTEASTKQERSRTGIRTRIQQKLGTMINKIKISENLNGEIRKYTKIKCHFQMTKL